MFVYEKNGKLNIAFQSTQIPAESPDVVIEDDNGTPTVTLGSNVVLTSVPAATASAVGGVKVGGVVADATDTTDVITQLNALLTALRTSGAIATAAE